MKTAATALTGLAFAGCLLAAGAANAELVQPGTYRLHNHPDANQAPPQYGLRLDELIDVTDERDVVTFDLYGRWLARTPILGWVNTDLRQIFEFRQTRVAALLDRARDVVA